MTAGGWSRARVAVFAGGVAALAVAALPPLASRADTSLTAHMVQHVLLLVVAAPLLALGVPWRPRSRTPWLAWASAALLAETVAMVGWHLPVLYGAALDHEPLHALEHGSYLATAFAFSSAVGVGSARHRGGAVAIVFLAAAPGSALGAALTLATRPWYPAYPSMADQQLAGVVMWAFAGLAYVLAAAALFGVWLRGLERESPSRPLVHGVTT